MAGKGIAFGKEQGGHHEGESQEWDEEKQRVSCKISQFLSQESGGEEGRKTGILH